MPTLDDIARNHDTDKATWTTHGATHGYTQVYERYFSPHRNREIRLLEMGLRYDPFHGNRDRNKPPSICTWLEYFSHAHIIGFDRNEFTLKHDRFTFVQGDQGNHDDLFRLSQQAPFHFIIDDCSHASWHQQAAFMWLWPHLVSGGIYFIEDLHYQPHEEETRLPLVPKTCSVFRSPVLKLITKTEFFLDNKLLAIFKP